MKIRYNVETGKVINAYNNDVIVPEPFITVEDEVWNDLSVEKDKLYVINNELVNITGTDKEKELNAQIVAKELSEQLYQLKAKMAYGGVTLNDAYIFETNATSILMTTTKYLDVVSNPEITMINHWKCYDLEGRPAFLNFTREQFIAIKNFATKMIDTDCFGVEDKYTKQLQSATVKQLNNPTWVNRLKAQAMAEMFAVETSLNIGEITLG